MTNETPPGSAQVTFTRADQVQLTRAMFDDEVVATRREQILLLDRLMDAKREGKLSSCTSVATAFQIEKERVKRGNANFKVAGKDEIPFFESGRKLLQRLPETLDLFYSGHQGCSVAWIVQLTHRKSEGGKKTWQLSIARRPEGDVRPPSEPAHAKGASDQPAPVGAEVRTLVPVDPFVTVPLRRHFIERLDISESVIEDLRSGSGPVGIIALNGMGGVGKTALAVALCHEQRVRQAFPDGIVWLRMSGEARKSFKDHVKEVFKALGEDCRDDSGLSYRTLLEKKTALVVLDNVWTLGDLEPFLLPVGNSRLLFTSRNKTLGASTRAAIHDVAELNDKQARELLEWWSDRPGRLPPQAADILEECGGLALAIAMTGAVLRIQRDEQQWVHVLADLKKARLKHFGTRPAGYNPYETLHAAIEVGVNALKPPVKAKYMQLAVLLEGMPAVPEVLQALWAVDEDEVHYFMGALADQSMVRCDADGLHVHDLQLKYIRGEYLNPEALALQHDALTYSYHIVSKYPEQFSSQMTGRLLSRVEHPCIEQFLGNLKNNYKSPRPWLRPLLPLLTLPGDGPVWRILSEHKDAITAVAITADGRRAVSVARDGELIEWNLENLKRRSRHGHRNSVAVIVFNSENSYEVFSNNEGEDVIVWGLDTEQGPRSLKGHVSTVSAFAVTADGRHVVSGSKDGKIIIWDLDSGEPLWRIEDVQGPVTAIALAPGGRRRAVFSFEESYLVSWDFADSPRPGLLGRYDSHHECPITSAVITADGMQAITGDYGGDLIVWDLDGRRRPRRPDGEANLGKQHGSSITSVAITPTGDCAVSGAVDHTIMVWDMEGHEPPRRLEGHKDAVTAVAVTSDGKRAISGSADQTLIVWDLKKSNPDPDPVTFVALTSDGKRALSGHDDGELVVWDFADQESPEPVSSYRHLVNTKAMGLLTAAGLRVVSCSRRGMLTIWDLEAQTPLHLLQGPEISMATAIGLSPDGKRAVTGNGDGELLLWELKGDTAPQLLSKTQCDAVAAVGVSSDGTVISAHRDGQLIAWSAKKLYCPHQLRGHKSPASAVAISADGVDAVSGHETGEVIVWRLQGRRLLRVLKRHGDKVTSIALTEDGKRAVTGSLDHTVTVWDLSSGDHLATFTCDWEVHSCAWVKKHIVSGDSRGQVHFLRWED
jgi:WD40 repeat protein